MGEDWYSVQGGSSSPSEDTWVAPSLLGADTVFFFSSSRSKTLFQEVNVPGAAISSAVPITQADTDAQAVGFMYDSSNNALKATAASSAVRPTLGSDVNRSTFIDFSGTQYLRITNSQSILKNFHKVNTAFSIFCWAKKDVDGTAMVLMSNTTGGSTAHGVYLATTTGNKLNFLITWGASGNPSVNYVTTASFTAAMGWQPIIVNIAGQGAGQGSIHIGSTVETFNVDNEGSTSLATGLMTFGATSNLTSFLNGQMDNFGAQNRLLTADELTNFKQYNPARDSSNFLIKEIEYDFNSTANMFADTTKTTPITDGTGIAAVTNKVTSNFGPRTDDLKQSTSGLCPVYRGNIVNGNGVAEYDGSDDTLVFDEQTERGGAWVIFVVVKQEDMTNGSHVAFSGNDVYWVQTGDNYTGGGPEANSPYNIVHLTVGSTPDAVYSEANPLNEYKVLAFRRVGSAVSSFGDKGINTSSVSVLQFAITQLGQTANGSALWQFDGNYVKFIKYNGYKTDAEILAEIADLVTAYN